MFCYDLQIEDIILMFMEHSCISFSIRYPVVAKSNSSVSLAYLEYPAY